MHAASRRCRRRSAPPRRAGSCRARSRAGPRPSRARRASTPACPMIGGEREHARRSPARPGCRTPTDPRACPSARRTPAPGTTAIGSSSSCRCAAALDRARAARGSAPRPGRARRRTRRRSARARRSPRDGEPEAERERQRSSSSPAPCAPRARTCARDEPAPDHDRADQEADRLADDRSTAERLERAARSRRPG